MTSPNNFIEKKDFAAISAHEISSTSGNISPFVSVLMLVYNHEFYLEQAIQSIIEQECAFQFELIIGEDYSQDRSREICISYQEQYPDIIRVVCADENVGMHKNFARIWHRARGKYIAACEGDDYWIDTAKLAKQVCWLEKRPEYSMCGTFTRKIIKDRQDRWVENGEIRPAVFRESYTIQDLISGYSFHFSSVVLKKDCIRFPSWFWQVYCVDRPLYLLCAEQGSVGLLPELTSVYRLHEGGIWSPVDMLDKAAKGINLFEHINKYFHYQYDSLIRKTLGQIIWFYMSEALQANDRKAGKKLLRLSIKFQFPVIGFAQCRAILVVLIRLYLPFLYQKVRAVREIL